MMRPLLMCAIALCSIVPALRAFDNAHFYRPPFFFGEPRFEKSGLTTFEFAVAGGKATSAQAKHGKVQLLDLYGNHTLAASAHGITNLDTQNPYDQLLQQVSAITSSDKNFGTLSLHSKMHICEIQGQWYQNLSHGFFIHAQIPWRYIAIKKINFTDLGSKASRQDPTWQDILRHFDEILDRLQLSHTSCKISGAGDPGFAIGWTTNYEQTTHLDFVDATLQCGVMLPMSTQAQPSHILSLPLGYNGRTGIFVEGQASLGLYDWLTMGIYTGATWFTAAPALQRVKTAAEQEGLLLRQIAFVRETGANLYSVGAYVKADHFVRGLSLLFGYRYDNRRPAHWYLCETKKPYSFCDERLLGWSMHTVHAMLSYDFATNHHPHAPELNVIFNETVGGKHILRAGMVGVDCSCSICWNCF